MQILLGAIKYWRIIVAVIAGFTMAWQIQAIRINNIKADLKVCKTELKQSQEYTQASLESLQKTNQSIEKIKVEYEKKLREYIKKTEKLRLKEQYEQIKPQEGLEVCDNLKAMLDRLAQVEEGK